MVAVAQIAGLAGLPYSTSLLTSASVDEASAPPMPDFWIGAVAFPVAAYAADGALEPFRALFRTHCHDLEGVTAAICVSDVLARAMTRGEPKDEFVNPAYDPVVSLREKLAGAPGHCVSRSALVVATLLSVGLPARVVQVIPPRTGGHHVTKVWDGSRGWLLFDPSFGSLVGASAAEPMSAVGALARPTLARLLHVGISPRRDLPNAEALYDDELWSGNLVYPEPWLYMRVGERTASWPFRGVFARVGATMLSVGPAQTLLRWGGLLTGFAAASCFIASVLIVARPRRQLRKVQARALLTVEPDRVPAANRAAHGG